MTGVQTCALPILEPKNKSSPAPPSLPPMNSGQSFYGTFSGVHLEAGCSSGGGDALLTKDPEPALKHQSAPLGSLLSLGGLGGPKAPALTSTPGPAKDSSALSKQGGRTEGLAGKEGTSRGEDRDREGAVGKVRLGSQEVGSEDELLLEEEEEEEEGSAVACGGNSSSGGGEVGGAAVSNQSISKSPLSMPSSALQPSACASAASPTLNSKGPASTCSSSAREEGSSAGDGGARSSELPLSFNCQGPSVPMATAAAAGRGSEDDGAGPSSSSPRAPGAAAADESANRDSATAPEPNDSPAEGEDDSGALLHHHHLHHHHHHLLPSPLSHPLAGGACDMAGMGECSQNHGPGGSGGSGVECPKCDTVLGSSRSLGGHMTMMHSRNSCKKIGRASCRERVSSPV